MVLSMKIKQLVSVLGMGIAALVSFSTTTAAEPEVTLKLHHMLPMSSTAHRRFLVPWADKVMAESNGRIQIDIYPSMQLGGKPASLYDQARKGVADIIWTVGGYTPGRFPKAGVFELPFMPASAKITSMALQEYAEQEMQDSFADVQLLALHTHAPGSIHSRTTPVSRLEDLAGLKIRASNKQMADALTLAGASPLFMPVPSVPSAFSKGVLDAALLPYEVVAPLKIHQMVDYHTEIHGDRGLYTQFFIFAMNKDAYAKLPADLQKVIDNNSGISTAGWIGAAWDESEQAGRKAAVEEGNQILVLSDSETARWKTTMQPVTDGWTKEMDAAGNDGQRLYQKAVDLINKYEQD